jgi:hypothetical protein
MAAAAGSLAASTKTSFGDSKADFPTKPTAAAPGVQQMAALVNDAAAWALATNPLAPAIGQDLLESSLKAEKAFKETLAAITADNTRLVTQLSQTSSAVTPDNFAALIDGVSPFALITQGLNDNLKKSIATAAALRALHVTLYNWQTLVDAIGSLTLAQLPVVTEEDLGLDVNCGKDPVIPPNLPIWEKYKAVRCFEKWDKDKLVPSFAARCAPVGSYNLTHAKIVYVYGKVGGGAPYRDAGSLIQRSGTFGKEHADRLGSLLQGKEFECDDGTKTKYRLI